MSYGKSKRLDDFWDLSSLVPKKKTFVGSAKSVDTVEIDISSKDAAVDNQNEDDKRLTFSEGSTISRKITIDHNEDENTAFEFIDQYFMNESPIHKVILKKRRTEYHFYNEFRNTAIELKDISAFECDYVPFFSYVPQYDQLTNEQREYYLWWRNCFEQGEYIKIDYSYVLLYIFELINLGATNDVKKSQYLLTEVWNVYHEEFPALSSKLSAWICDFSFIHKLSPPKNADRNILKNENSLKEFYIEMPNKDPEACVRSLIKYCSSYDYRSSKFAKDENRELFDKHILGALVYAWRNCNDGKGFLEGFDVGDSRMTREAYAGALCCSHEKYRIDIEYSSFSRMNELRYQIGDMIKYAENKIRAAIGTKSKLMVYASVTELYKAIDKYFNINLPPRSKVKKKAPAAQEYDVLYEAPKKEFSIKDAKRIEEDSWETINDLVSAFDEIKTESSIDVIDEPLPVVEEEIIEDISQDGEKTLSQALGDLLTFAIAVKRGDKSAQESEAVRLSKLKDSIVDEINDIAVEMMGDILIEDGEDGYEIPEFYSDIL